MSIIAKNGHAPSKNGHAPSLHSDANASHGKVPLVEAVQMNLPWAELLPTTTTEDTTESALLEIKQSKRYHETGHAINVQNFEILRQTVISFGAAYVASNPLYAVANLEAMYDDANNAVATVIDKLTANQECIDMQTATFKDLKKTATRSKNIFAASAVPMEAVKRCVHINNSIQGGRMKKIKADDDNKRHISASHQSMAQQVIHVNEFIELFETYPQYNPPADLTAQAWTNKRDAMKDAITNVTVSGVDLKFARMSRNFVMYKPATGLVDVALGVKKTVLGIFGALSPQYRMVSGIPFRRINGYKGL